MDDALPSSQWGYLHRSVSAPPPKLAAAGLAVAALASCTGDDASPAAEPPADPPYVPAAESCAAPSLSAPTTFVPCSTGGGIFGAWTVDPSGLPAYDYGLDQNADERARWDNTEEQDRRAHWASFGNARITAMASNDGWIEVTTQDRGVTYLDKVDEAAGAFGGGFSYVDDGEATWSTAYKWRPRGSRTARRFGMGYAEASMAYRGITVAHQTYAPRGDATFVIDEVTIDNGGASPRTLRHYEYWDVRRRPIEIDWLVSGKPFAIAPANAANRRDARNAMFDEHATWDATSRVLGLRRTHAAATVPDPRDAPSNVDYYPGDPFLATLVGDVSDVYTDDARFFGALPSGGDAPASDAPARPRVVTARLDGELASLDAAPRSGEGQPRSFVVRTDLVLAPGEERTLRFAYGYAPMGEPWPTLATFTDPTSDPRAEARADTREHLLYVATERDPFLHRELAWHASQIEASVGYRDYWGHHVVPQGSAYLYLHGADGALRDTALFAMPLVYTHPALAKEQLSLAMGAAFADDSRFSYSFQGHGRLDDALGLHSRPSGEHLILGALAHRVGAAVVARAIERGVIEPSLVDGRRTDEAHGGDPHFVKAEVVAEAREAVGHPIGRRLRAHVEPLGRGAHPSRDRERAAERLMHAVARSRRGARVGPRAREEPDVIAGRVRVGEALEPAAYPAHPRPREHVDVDHRRIARGAGRRVRPIRRASERRDVVTTAVATDGV